MCLGQPHLLRAMPAGLLSAQGSLRNGFCSAFALEKAVEEGHLCCLRVWQGAWGVLQSLSSLDVAPGCGACRGVQAFGLLQFECLGAPNISL